QCLMWALFVVPADPRGQLTLRVVEAGEVVLPDTFLLQAAEEALDDAVLLRRVGRDELLGQPIVATRRPKPPALIDQDVVRADAGVAGRGDGVPRRFAASQSVRGTPPRARVRPPGPARSGRTRGRSVLDHGSRSLPPGAPSHLVRNTRASDRWPIARCSAPPD